MNDFLADQKEEFSPYEQIIRPLAEEFLTHTIIFISNVLLVLEMIPS